MDKMREEFEAWFKREYGCDPLTYSDGTYVMDYARRTWISWQASRAELCVELPESCYGDIREACVVSALDKAGVSYK